MCSGRSCGRRHPGRVSRQHLAPEDGGQHRANQFGAAAVEMDDAVQDPHGSLNKEIWRTKKKVVDVMQCSDMICRLSSERDAQLKLEMYTTGQKF